MSAAFQSSDLALLLLGGISLLMLVFGLVWRSRKPRDDARTRVRREALSPLDVNVPRLPTATGSILPEPSGASAPVRVQGRSRAATSATAARQAAKSALMAGDVRVAADAYRGAGLVDEAVNLLVGVLGAHAEGAQLLVTAGRHERAAELFQSAGKKLEAAQQWAEVARRSAHPGALIESIAALDLGVAQKLLGDLGNTADHPDAEAIAAASRQVKRLETAARVSARPLPREDPSEDDGEAAGAQLSDEEAEQLAGQATRVMVWRGEEPRAVEEAAPPGDDTVPPPRPSFPSLVESPFDDEEPLDLAVLDDEAVAMARVGPPVSQIDAYVKGPCTSANVDMYYRVAMTTIARGAWNRAVELLEAVERVSPGYREARAKSEAIGAWRKRLGARRLVASGRYEIAGEWRRHRHAISFRGFDHAERRDVLLHRLSSLRSVEAALEACPSLRSFGTLLHPGLVRVYDVFLDDLGRVVVATELSDAATLKERIASAPLPAAECLRVGVEVAAACEHLHARGLGAQGVHPGVVSSVPGGLVKLEPLGLDALLDGPLDHQRRLEPYLAPEGHQAHDERCTVFAVGATMFHAITRRPPAPGELVTIDSLKNLKVPGALAAIVARAMAPTPAARFPSSNGLRLTLRSLLRQVQGRASQTRLSVTGLK